ncbi:hypothetical protein SOVF_154810, partial [Spinacia oleracea]
RILCFTNSIPSSPLFPSLVPLWFFSLGKTRTTTLTAHTSLLPPRVAGAVPSPIADDVPLLHRVAASPPPRRSFSSTASQLLLHGVAAAPPPPPPCGVVMFTRSLLPYKRQGIRVNVLCPEVRCLYSMLHI